MPGVHAVMEVQEGELGFQSELPTLHWEDETGKESQSCQQDVVPWAVHQVEGILRQLIITG